MRCGTKIIGFHNDAAGRSAERVAGRLQVRVRQQPAQPGHRRADVRIRLHQGQLAQAVDLYTRQCSIGVNAKDLATMAATLASGGTNPVTGKHVVDTAKVPSVLAVMSTAGLYDDSGKWLYQTGLPAKSGVGGGIIAVSPGKFGIAVISPPLDDAGNSVRAQRAIAEISRALGGNPYAAKTTTPAAAAEPKPSFEIYGFRDARHGAELQANQPQLVRHDARHQAAVVRGSVTARTTAFSPACDRAVSASSLRRQPKWAT